jgi:PhnB protein
MKLTKSRSRGDDMELSPYLNFDGQCAQAFRFYEKVLGGRIEFMQTHGESPMKDQVPADWHDKVMHVRLTVDNFALMGSDAPAQHYARPQGYAVSINLQDVGQAQRIFTQLSEGGRVTMPFDKTFWSPGFGMCTDRFGTPWMVNVNQEP